ncbi:MAG TPA: chemotaxis protein CheW [Allocoleopsis sp.]
MATLSSLKSRRFGAKQTEATQQILTFRLDQEWFALPIQAVQKVVSLGQVYGDPQRSGVSLTLYQNRELVVVDVGHRIFGRTPSQETSAPASTGHSFSQDLGLTRYLLVLQTRSGELVGLPIDSQPALRRVPMSAFGPLPAAYATEGNIRCVSSLMLQTAEELPLFLLDPEVLLQPQLLKASTTTG